MLQRKEEYTLEPVISFRSATGLLDTSCLDRGIGVRQGRGAGGQQRQALVCPGQTEWKCNTQTHRGAGQQRTEEKGHREEEPKGGEDEAVPRTEEHAGTMPR